MLLGVCSGPALAQVAVRGVRWQVGLKSGKPGGVFHDAKTWLLPPGSAGGRVRAMVSLSNRGARSQDAVLVRFSVSARLAKEPGGESLWAVPFILEDRRVPKIRAGAGLEVAVPVNRAALAAYLQRLHGAGFWPDALRIEVMVEPRRGEELSERLASETLTVLWKPAPGQGQP